MTSRRASDVRVVLLRPSTAALLAIRVVGRGGFQTLIRRLQSGLAGHVLTATVADIDRLIGYCQGPRAGGFQRRLWAVVCDVVVASVRPRLLRVPARRRSAAS